MSVKYTYSYILDTISLCSLTSTHRSLEDSTLWYSGMLLYRINTSL